MPAFDTLLNDPIAQLGYGLLVAGAPGGDMQQGFASALGLMESGEARKRQAKQDAMQEKLYQLKLADAQRPDMQYMISPTGEVVGIDKRSGIAGNVPIGQFGQPQAPSGDLPMPPLPGSGEAAAPSITKPAFSTPVARAEHEKKIAERQAQKQFPTPAEEEKQRELDKQAQGKIEMAAETKRLIDEILMDKDAIRSAVGPISSQLPTLRGSTAEAENKIRRLRNLATAENLKLMSGVLSESDIKILADLAGGQYDLSRSDNALISDLERAQQSMNRTLFGQNAPQGTQNGFSIRRVR